MIINVKVIPNSSKNSVEKQLDGQYRVHVREKPIEGKATDAVKKELAKHFNLSCENIEIKPTKSRKKRVVLKNINA